MYAYIDQPVERLCMSGRFLLWAMRGWSQARETGNCQPVALTAGFEGVGALPALPDFHIAMAMLNRDALETISLAPLRHKRIAEHEALLIGLWRDIGLGDLDRLHATLRLMVEEDMVGPLSRALFACAAQLVAMGFDLSGLARETLKEED